MRALKIDPNASGVTGYLHSSYAQSLSEFGTPRQMPRSQSWILERPISGSPYSDGMGCYPVFSCGDWKQLDADLEEIGKGLISLSVVTDPFGEYDQAYLRDCFRDLVIPFKQHFVVDLSRPADSFVSPHHRRNARKALEVITVERCKSASNFLDDWIGLYEALTERHDITGIAAFSRKSFAGQLAVPGMVAFRAVHDGSSVGMLLWYTQNERAYYHLGAFSPLGYQLRASFALFDYSIQYFAELGLAWLNLGAGTGIQDRESDGLIRFKRGWSTGTRTAYFCGRIFDREKYTAIVRAKGVGETDFFPAYRESEFERASLPVFTRA